MRAKIDNNGNIHIPKIMKDTLNIKNGQNVNIECERGKIIITNTKSIRSREEIKGFLSDLQEYNDDISKGMKSMAEWVLYEDYESRDEE